MYGDHTGTRPGSTVELPSAATALTQLRNSPPALLGPPIWNLPAVVCGSVHRPGTSRYSGTVTHTISVVPHSTTTSPSRVASVTNCSHTASTEPAASTVSPPFSRPTAVPVCSTLGMPSGTTPQSAQASSLQPLPSYKG